MTLDDIWNRVVALAGQEFETTTGLAFTYTLRGSNAIVPSRTEQQISRGEFEKYVDLSNRGMTTNEINQVVRGSSYVRAILEDPRVR